MGATRKRTANFIDTVTCGDCNSLVKRLESTSVDGVVIDPPYGAGLAFEGDKNIRQAARLLGTFLRNSYRVLKANGYVAIFWTSLHLDVCIDAVREAGLAYRRTLVMYLKQGSARPHLGWLPRFQPIVVAQRVLQDVRGDYHYAVAEYLSAAMKRKRVSRATLAKKLRCHTRLVMKWSRVGDPFYCLPSPANYSRLKSILGLDGQFDELLDAGLAGARRVKRKDFEFHHDCYVVDGVSEKKKQHPAQKPLDVVRHIVTCIAPEGGVVLDGFAGSGTTAVAAKLSGRRFICFEASAKYCKIAEQRLKKGK